MNALLAVSGSRLAYVAIPVKDKVKRFKVEHVKGKGLMHTPYTIDGKTYMVYFPRGHALHMTEREMKRFKYEGKPLTAKPRIVNLQGLSDPNSAIGKIMAADNDKQREAGWKDLERMTIRLATAKTGPALLTVDAPIPETAEIEE